MLHRWHLAVILWALIASPIAAEENVWGSDPATAEFWHGLMQPDNQNQSCCGPADGYYADETEYTPDGHLIAIITDTRDDEKLGRAHIEPGTKFLIPRWKIRHPPSANPTTHNVIFIGGGNVYCWEPVAKG